MGGPAIRSFEGNTPESAYDYLLVLSGISGELMTEIGMEVKKLSPYSNTVIVTHCNGSSGYICTDKAFPEGGYEIQTTKLMPGAEKPLTQKFLELIHSF